MAQLYIVMKNIYGRIAISEILPDKDHLGIWNKVLYIL